MSAQQNPAAAAPLTDIHILQCCSVMSARLWRFLTISWFICTFKNILPCANNGAKKTARRTESIGTLQHLDISFRFILACNSNKCEETLEPLYSKNFKSTSKSYMRPGQSVTSHLLCASPCPLLCDVSSESYLFTILVIFFLIRLNLFLYGPIATEQISVISLKHRRTDAALNQSGSATRRASTWRGWTASRFEMRFYAFSQSVRENHFDSHRLPTPYSHQPLPDFLSFQ